MFVCFNVWIQVELWCIEWVIIICNQQFYFKHFYFHLSSNDKTELWKNHDLLNISTLYSDPWEKQKYNEHRTFTFLLTETSWYFSQCKSKLEFFSCKRSSEIKTMQMNTAFSKHKFRRKKQTCVWTRYWNYKYLRFLLMQIKIPNLLCWNQI